MGHYVQAFIGARPILDLIQRRYERSQVIELEQGVALLPLLDELYDAVQEVEPAGLAQSNFIFLTPKIIDLLKEISTYGVIGYFETNYAGGSGEQGAIVARLGEVTFGPKVGFDSINQMLNQLGVRRKGTLDEYDAICLGRFRNNKSWIEKHGMAEQATATVTLTGSLISWIHRFGKK